MENNKKISSNLIIFIGIFYGINYGSLCYSSLIMKDFDKIAWLIPLLTLIPFILLVFLYKPSNNLNNYKNNKIFKILMLISSFFNSAMWIYLSSQMLGISFYNLTQVSFFAVFTLVVVIILSNMNLKVILRLGVLFTTGFLFFVPLLLDYQNTYQPYLDIMRPIDLSIFKGLYFITIVNELFLYTTTNDMYEKPLSRKQLILAGIVILFITSLQIIDSYVMVTYKYYENIMFPSLNRYFSHKGDRFFEHYDTLLLFIMLITALYKSSYYITKTKYFFECKNTIFNLFFYFFLFILVFLILLNQDHFNTYMKVITIIGLFLTTYIIYLSRKGGKKAYDSETTFDTKK